MSGRLLARVIIGGLFAGHGTQKLFGWSGGPGQEGTGQMMDKIGMRYEWPGAPSQPGMALRRMRCGWRQHPFAYP